MQRDLMVQSNPYDDESYKQWERKKYMALLIIKGVE